MAFDEGGIGSRHRLNPVRMYNASKPQKFRVNFFLFSVTGADRYILLRTLIYIRVQTLIISISNQKQDA